MKNFITLIFISTFLSFSLYAQDKKASVTFDGDDDHILILHDAVLNLGTGTFTFEAWITIPPTQTAENPIVISKKGTQGTAQDGFLFGLSNSGKVALSLEGVSFIPGFGGWGLPGQRAEDLRDGICHHIAATLVKGGVQDTVELFQDGYYIRASRKGTGTTKPDISNTEDVWIGWSEDFITPDLYQFDGEIKEVRIWNVTRTESEIYNNRDVHLTGNEPGLVGYWRLNENKGQTVYDCSGNGNNGLMKNGASWKIYNCDNMQGPTPSCFNGQPLGLENQLSNTNLKIYPNPVSQEIRLESNRDTEIDRVVIFDLNGRSVINSFWDGKDALDISNLQGGTYMIQLSNKNQLIHKTILIKE